MTKLTLNQAFSIHTTISSLSSSRFPSKTSYWLAYTKRKLGVVSDSFSEIRRQRALDLDIVTGDELDTTKQNYQCFVDEMEALLQDDAGDDFRSGKTSLFTDTTIPAGALVQLLPLLDDDTGLSFSETELDYGEVVDLCDILSAELSQPHPFSASYVLARIFDAVFPTTKDYRKVRLDRGFETGTVEPTGRIRTDHPAFPAYLAEMQGLLKGRGKVTVRHPIVKPSHFDGDDYPPIIFDALWFIFDES